MKYIQITPDGEERPASRADVLRAVRDHQPHQRADLLRKVRDGEVIYDQYGYGVCRLHRPETDPWG